VQLKHQAPDCRWDLVVCDEAHKMSATVFGGEAKCTKRYRLGQLLSTLTRHFLLMSATPHNGKEADFQLFMALLDGDRFEGRYRDVVHTADVSYLMRRMVKESLLKFDGTPLFPERIAYTVPYSSRMQKPRSTRPLPTTSARNSTAPKHWKTTSVPAPSACADYPAAASCILTGGHLPISAPPAGTAGKPASRAGGASARRPGGAHARRITSHPGQ
jgi:hypothetical protein